MYSYVVAEIWEAFGLVRKAGEGIRRETGP